jgi:Na+/phosphate symporter
MVENADAARQSVESLSRDKLERAQRHYAETPSEKAHLGLLRALQQFTDLVMNRQKPDR